MLLVAEAAMVASRGNGFGNTGVMLRQEILELRHRDSREDGLSKRCPKSAEC